MELICDGYHIHGAVVRATFSMMGSERMVLISDSMMATQECRTERIPSGTGCLDERRKSNLTDGETIAGSATNLYDCMKKQFRLIFRWQMPFLRQQEIRHRHRYLR